MLSNKHRFILDVNLSLVDRSFAHLPRDSTPKPTCPPSHGDQQFSHVQRKLLKAKNRWNHHGNIPRMGGYVGRLLGLLGVEAWHLIKSDKVWWNHCWWQPKIRQTHQLRLVVLSLYLNLQGLSTIPSGWPWDFWLPSTVGGHTRSEWIMFMTFPWAGIVEPLVHGFQQERKTMATKLLWLRSIIHDPSTLRKGPNMKKHMSGFAASRSWYALTLCVAVLIRFHYPKASLFLVINFHSLILDVQSEQRPNAVQRQESILKIDAKDVSIYGHPPQDLPNICIIQSKLASWPS